MKKRQWRGVERVGSNALVVEFGTSTARPLLKEQQTRKCGFSWLPEGLKLTI
jgi:hypothetical protein